MKSECRNCRHCSHSSNLFCSINIKNVKPEQTCSKFSPLTPDIIAMRLDELKRETITLRVNDRERFDDVNTLQENVDDLFLSIGSLRERCEAMESALAIHKCVLDFILERIETPKLIPSDNNIKDNDFKDFCISDAEICKCCKNKDTEVCLRCSHFPF